MSGWNKLKTNVWRFALGAALWLALPSGAFGDARFFLNAMPSLTLTSAQPMANIDERPLGPEDYRRYYAFPSPLNAGFQLTSGGAELVFRVDFRPDFISFQTDSRSTNLPLVQNDFISAMGDANMPTVGYIAYEGSQMSLSAGRRMLKWGPATYGLAISDSAPYLDAISFEYRFPAERGFWWYDFLAIGADRMGTSWANLGTGSFGYKSIFAHRGGYQGETLRVSVAELNLVHDIAPSLMDMSPVAAFHNLYEDVYSNVMLQASAEFKAGHARLYGEFVIDDLVMGWESWNYRPTAMGWVTGASLKLAEGAPFVSARFLEGDYALRDPSLKEPGGLSLSFEHYRTTTYLYNRENSSGKWVLPDHRLVNDSRGYIDTAEAFYLGFPYGPDVGLDMLSLSWEQRNLRVALDLKYLRQGSYGILDPYPPSDGQATWFALQEPVARSFVASVMAEFAFSPSLLLKLGGELRLGAEEGGEVNAGCLYRIGT